MKPWKSNISAAALAALPAPNFGPNFNAHVMNPTIAGHQISGLHCLPSPLPANYVVTNQIHDSKVPTVFQATITINDASKTGTFFPSGTTIQAIRTIVTEAYRDYQAFHARSEVYSQMMTKYGLPWIGYGTIGGTKIWISGLSTQNQLSTAFPAVNGKFV
jgi:hypothetical protein